MTFDAHVVLNTNEIYLLENVFIDEKLPGNEKKKNWAKFLGVEPCNLFIAFQLVALRCS